MIFIEGVAVLIVVICCTVVVHFVLRNRHQTKILLQKDTRNRRIIFVTAHPDDECMFFAPAILSLSQLGQYDIFLLCFSSGNFYNQGRIRQQELMQSCQILGIRQSNVFIIDRRDLSDDPSQSWDAELISKLLADYVKDYYIDMIFTFDEYGVSGHVNHTSLYFGVRHFLSEKNCPAGIEGYRLVSINIFRKYLSILELVISYFTSSIIFISPWSDVLKAQKAMYAHRSQFVWFRILYIIFSRYIIINSYEPIHAHRKSLKKNT